MVLGEAQDWNRPPWPGTIGTICMSCVSWQEVLVKNTELTSHPQLEELWKDQKETPRVQPPPRILLPGNILAEQGMHHQEGLWVEWLAKDNPKTNPITIKSKAVSHMAE